jgi:hypothetical protein
VVVMVVLVMKSEVKRRSWAIYLQILHRCDVRGMARSCQVWEDRGPQLTDVRATYSLESSKECRKCVTLSFNSFILRLQTETPSLSRDDYVVLRTRHDIPMPYAIHSPDEWLGKT